MKRTSWLGVLLFLCLLFPAVARAEDAIKVYLNGQLLPNVFSVVSSEANYVPASFISEHLGAQVNWDAKTKEADIRHGNQKLRFAVGKPVVDANGKTLYAEGSPYVENGEIMFPLDIIAGQFNLSARYDKLTRSLVLFRKKDVSRDVPKENVPRETDSSQKEGLNHQDGKGGNVSGGGQAPAENGGNRTGEAGKADPVQGEIFGIRVEQGDVVVQSTHPIVSKISQMENPDRLIVDLIGARPGASVNGQPWTQNGEVAVENHPVVGKIRYALYSENPSTVRIVMDLKQKADYKIVPQDDKRVLRLSVTAKKVKIVIDPGHGGKDPGATSVSGRLEKNFNLAVSQKVYRLLSQDPAFAPYMTREDDVFVSLDDRVSFANNLGADLFISIHGNSYLPHLRGTEIYYWREESLGFAQAVHRRITASSGLPDRGIIKNNFRVITYTEMPAVLVELGYLSNGEDENIMMTEAYQERVAQAIVAAIQDYLSP